MKFYLYPCILSSLHTSTCPAIVKSSVGEPPLFWAAPAPDGQGPGADSGSDILGSAPAQTYLGGRHLQAKRGGSGSIH